MSRRTEKINSSLIRDLSNIINNDINDPRIKGLITIANVSISPDLKNCKVFLSIYDDNKEEILKTLKTASGFIKKLLAQKINFRSVPNLDFYLDNSAEYSQRIDNILDDIKSKK